MQWCGRGIRCAKWETHRRRGLCWGRVPYVLAIVDGSVYLSRRFGKLGSVGGHDGEHVMFETVILAIKGTELALTGVVLLCYTVLMAVNGREDRPPSPPQPPEESSSIDPANPDGRVPFSPEERSPAKEKGKACAHGLLAPFSEGPLPVKEKGKEYVEFFKESDVFPLSEPSDMGLDSHYDWLVREVGHGACIASREACAHVNIYVETAVVDALACSDKGSLEQALEKIRANAKQFGYGTVVFRSGTNYVVISMSE